MKASRIRRTTETIAFYANLIDAIELCNYARAFADRIRHHEQRRRASLLVVRQQKEQSPADEAFWNYWNTLGRHEQQQLWERYAPQATLRILHINEEVKWLPLRIVQLWEAGDRFLAKSEMRRLYQLETERHLLGVERIKCVRRCLIDLRGAVNELSP